VCNSFLRRSKDKTFCINGSACCCGGKLFDFYFRIQDEKSFILLNPWEDPKGAGWQVIQSLYAIGSGGLFGRGLGNSLQKFLYIPEPYNDFILAVLAEELGFIGVALVLLLFLIFIWRGVKVP